MLHVLLLILKIILWIVLGLLALVLLLLLTALFVPIHYSANVVVDDNASVAARVRFLMVSFMVDFDRKAKKLDTTLRIFGIRFGKGKHTETEHGNKKTAVSSHNDDNAEYKGINADGDSDVNALQNESDTEKKQESIQTGTEADEETNLQANVNADEETILQVNADEAAGIKSDAEEAEDMQNQEPEKKKKKEKKKEKDKASSNNLKTGKNKLDAVKDKLELVKTKYRRVIKFWNMGCTLKTRRYLKRYFPKLIRHIGPRKLKGYVRYGFDEPATTGQITGYLSLLPFMYQKNFYPEPDFYNKVLECDVSLRGWLQLGYIIRPVLRLHIWKTIKMARKI